MLRCDQCTTFSRESRLNLGISPVCALHVTREKLVNPLLLKVSFKAFSGSSLRKRKELHFDILGRLGSGEALYDQRAIFV